MSSGPSEEKKLGVICADAVTQRYQQLTLSVKEAAKALGLSRNSTYQACQEGKIPHITIGRRILIPRAALDKMLAEAGKERGDKQ